jgi:hypothetical protein
LLRDDDAEDRHANILRDLYTVKGLSRDTMGAVQAGEVEIVSDDEQAEMLKRLGGQQ